MGDDISRIPLHQSRYECDIIETSSLEIMVSLLNKALANGWRLQGGISTYYSRADDYLSPWRVNYVQVVICDRKELK